MLLIAYTLLIIYARVVLTPLYSMLVLFADCWEIKLLTQAGLEKLNGELDQPSRIRYVSRSFSVKCFISLAYWEGIYFHGYSVCCGTPQAIGSFLHNSGFRLRFCRVNFFFQLGITFSKISGRRFCEKFSVSDFVALHS